MGILKEAPDAQDSESDRFGIDDTGRECTDIFYIERVRVGVPSLEPVASLVSRHSELPESR